MQDEKTEKDLKKLKTLEKKQKLWGLSEEEKKEIHELQTKFLFIIYQNLDDIYIEYIEPLLYTEDIIEIKAKIYSLSNWDDRLPFEECQTHELFDNIKSEDCPEIIKQLGILKNQLLKQVNKTNAGLLAMIEKINEINEFKNLTSIKKYINQRYLMMIDIVGELECF